MMVLSSNFEVGVRCIKSVMFLAIQRRYDRVDIHCLCGL